MLCADFYFPLPAFIGFYCFLLTSIGFLHTSTAFYWHLLTSTGLLLICLLSTDLYGFLLTFTDHCTDCWSSINFFSFYWLLLTSTCFLLTSVGFLLTLTSFLLTSSGFLLTSTGFLLTTTFEIWSMFGHLEPFFFDHGHKTKSIILRQKILSNQKEKIPSQMEVYHRQHVFWP